jgi:hypothetical protein
MLPAFVIKNYLILKDVYYFDLKKIKFNLEIIFITK